MQINKRGKIKYRRRISDIKTFLWNNWSDFLYFLSLFFVFFRSIDLCGRDLRVLLLTLAIIALLVFARVFRSSWKIKYALTGLCFGLVMVVVQVTDLDHVPFLRYSYVTLPYFTFLFHDGLTPFLVTAVFILKYLSYSPEVSMDQITAQIIGVFSMTVLFVIIYKFFSALLRKNEEYKRLSLTDSLTGTFNLAHVIDQGNTLLERRKEITIVVIDLDNFKQLNDNFGHLAGNNILREIAGLLIAKTEDSSGLIGRMGGDEFVVILEDDKHIDVLQFVEHLYQVVHEKRYEVDPDLDPIVLSFSFGICHSSDYTNIEQVDKLLHKADVDMYYNKYKSKGEKSKERFYHHYLPDKIIRYLNVLAEKDMYTYVHSEYVAKYSALLAQQIGLSWEKTVEIYIAGWLHDIGKILISTNILRKTGSLEEAEYQVIKEHIDTGMNFLNMLDVSDTIKNGIHYHHEHWDGSGYPDKLKAEEIPIEGRIIKLVDSYSAMYIKRVYRPPLSQQEALAEIKRMAGIHFDPQLVGEFEKCLTTGRRKEIIESINNWIDNNHYVIKLF